MSIHAKTTDHDQIAALVKGVERLPLKALRNEYLEIIVEGLSWAFKEAKTDTPGIVATGNEVDITTLIESHLKRRKNQDPYWDDLVASVTRGTESMNYDGTRKELRPDLSVEFNDHYRRFPLVVETKIINRSGKTVKLYCDNGVRRFQTGDYGWGCQEGMMLAYVQDGSDLAAVLTPEITKNISSGISKFGTINGLSISSTDIGELAFSQHDRSFLYPLQQPPYHEPGPISIWHLWLR